MISQLIFCEFYLFINNSIVGTWERALLEPLISQLDFFFFFNDRVLISQVKMRDESQVRWRNERVRQRSSRQEELWLRQRDSVANGKGGKRKRIKVFYILLKKTSNSIFNIKNQEKKEQAQVLLQGIFLILTTISKLKDESNNCCKLNTVFGSVEGREKGKIGRKKNQVSLIQLRKERKREMHGVSFFWGPQMHLICEHKFVQKEKLLH